MWFRDKLKPEFEKETKAQVNSLLRNKITFNFKKAIYIHFLILFRQPVGFSPNSAATALFTVYDISPNKDVIGVKGITIKSKCIWNSFFLFYIYIYFRAFWSIAIVLSLYLCGISVHNTFLKWQRNPVQISFTEKDIFVSDIPFPKITICPEVKADKFKIHLESFLAEQRNNASAIETK